MIARFFYPVWTFVQSAVVSILGKRKRETSPNTIANNIYDELPPPSPVDSPPSSVDSLFGGSSNGEVTMDIDYYLNYIDYDLSADGNDDHWIVPTLLSVTKNTEHYKSCVVNIKKIIKHDNNDDFIKIINDFVIKFHVLRMITTHVLKLYLIFNENRVLIGEMLNEKFILILIEVICDLKRIMHVEQSSRRSGRPSAPPRHFEMYYTADLDVDNTFVGDIIDNDTNRLIVIEFLKTVLMNCDPTIKDLILNLGIERRGLANALSFIASEILKSYNQNIVMNYKKYVDRYVNVMFMQGKKQTMLEIDESDASKKEKTLLKNAYLLKLKHIKNDIVEVNNADMKSSDEAALLFIQENKQFIFPSNKTR